MKMSKNFATNKLKIQKKQLSAAISLALMLTIVATLVTSVPNTYGQYSGLGQLLTSNIATFVLLNPIGLGQTQMVRSTIYPLAYSINHTYTITRPDGTTFTLVNASDVRNEEAFVTFVCDQLGTWKVTVSWLGDATHQPCCSSFSSVCYPNMGCAVRSCDRPTSENHNTKPRFYSA